MSLKITRGFEFLTCQLLKFAIGMWKMAVGIFLKSIMKSQLDLITAVKVITVRTLDYTRECLHVV